MNTIYPTPDKVWLGSSDGMIRVYDPTSWKLLHVLSEHTGTNSPDMVNNHSHCTLMSRREIMLFPCGLTGGIKCITGTEDAIWSSAEDWTIIQRSPADGSFVKQFVGHTSWVHSMVVDPVTGFLWSGSMDGIRIWDPTPPPEGLGVGGDSKEASDEQLASEMALSPEEREKREQARKRVAEQHQHIVALSRAKSAANIAQSGSSGAKSGASAVAGNDAELPPAADAGAVHADADCLFLLSSVHRFTYCCLLWH